MPDIPDLVLFDGSSYLYRAFHALPPLSSSQGEPTGAVLGVLNMLAKFLREYPAPRVAVVFDAPGKTFRDELFTAYKAHRPSMPQELRAQVTPLLEIIAAQGLPLLRIAGVEADDVIGTLARRAAAAGSRVVICTGDKDMAQLVDGSITLINTMNNMRLDRAGVKSKFDVMPEQIVDYLALAGDSSDNIPGIRQVGPKTAARLLGQYGSLDNLVAHASEIGGKVGENLRTGLATLELSRQLATIRTDVDLPLGPNDLAPGEPDVPRLRALYSRFDLRALLHQLDQEHPAAAGRADADAEQRADAPAAAGAAVDGSTAEHAGTMPQRPAAAPAARDYATVLTRSDLQHWLTQLERAELIAFDTETTSLDYMQAQIVGLSFSLEPGKAAYVPLAHDYADAPAQLDRTETLEALRPLLEDPRRGKLGHHLKYDAHVLANHGIALAGMRYDSMLESYVWDSVATRHDMDSAARRYLGVHTIAYEALAGKGAKAIPFSQVPIARAAEYAAEDADITLQLHRTLWPRITSVPALERLYTDIEQPLVPVLLRMERRGVLIDRERLRAQSGELAARMAQLVGQAHEEAGSAFNIDSPKQLRAVLFEKLGLPVLRKTPTGQPSTAEDVLEELSAAYPLPRTVLDYRALAKLKSTYAEKLPEQINPRTGRVHTSYHQAVAQTGRLSSTDPNLQNIPIRTPEGRRIRQAFLAPPGHVLLAADYSQIELRIMAHLSGDEGLLRAFAEERDVHQATAAEVFAASPSEVTPDQRRLAKTINFGLIYGMSAFGLARQLGIDRAAAQSYVERYFQRYPDVRRFMDETRRRAREQGYVETVFGRRLYLPEINAKNPQRRQGAERAAINAPMQGTAADLIKLAMIAVQDHLDRHSLQTRLVMQVHDELVLEVPEGELPGIKEALAALMCNVAQLEVPLRAEVGIGPNWERAH